MSGLVHEIVHDAYWRDDVNCAVAMLRVLGAVTGQVLSPQVFAAANGMNGAGRSRAQCGLVEGGLMFLGVWGQELGRSSEDVVGWCNEYAREFTARFGSLLCRDLRPQGFVSGQPPHLCAQLTLDAATWAADWIKRCEEGRK